MINKNFWKGKSVFITGHTGFKGSWLCLWLQSLGANVTGFALTPQTEPSMFELCHVNKEMTSMIGDICNREQVKVALIGCNPDILFHMAAQPIVKESYQNPVETFETNVMGTVNLLEAVREYSVHNKKVIAVVNVTSDKCYENKEWSWGYRENEPMGGYDPYSSSKACSELITSSYRRSFFHPDMFNMHGVVLASARAGNVIGGGDWAQDRLVPDCMRSFLKQEEIMIRNPNSIRPWQHVLEPLNGYLLLAERLYSRNGIKYADGWNFGPSDLDEKTVGWIVKRLCSMWGEDISYTFSNNTEVHEAHFLKLDCSKAKMELGWVPKWNIEYALEQVIIWLKAYQAGSNLKDVCLKQIRDYEEGNLRNGS